MHLMHLLQFQIVLQRIISSDTDGDGINDNIEVTNGYNPTIQDSDGDTLLDNEEDVNWERDVTLKNVPILDVEKPLFFISSGATVNRPPDLWKNVETVINPTGINPDLINIKITFRIFLFFVLFFLFLIISDDFDCGSMTVVNIS